MAKVIETVETCRCFSRMLGEEITSASARVADRVQDGSECSNEIRKTVEEFGDTIIALTYIFSGIGLAACLGGPVILAWKVVNKFKR